MTETVFDPSKVGSLTLPEKAVWGLAHFMAHGDWHRYGVLPPRGLTGVVPITTDRIADLLGITKEHADALWVGLRTKGAIR